ncbi:Ferrous iron transport protein B [Thalassoglobus neptunius]|uniref:Ferrous iron transport protein B n=1 Tax=Thalassoglobus neptunius TaxID=1938619 RepID=A0A5C5VYA5_9PLAN|nr:ferrous iron transport protein B [Thalassoglobus neptunius]TWT43005.1 Ferrous iron transport protein B [Thalassoglobus neptunius]
MHETVQPATSLQSLTVALIGNPNTGKSTLFNSLCGGKARVGNFPGVTVEKKVGKYRFGDRQITLVDLPGTYSLSPRSADEMVSVDVLLGRQKEVTAPDAVVCIVDASNLERNLYLFSQIRDLNLPTVLVLNMWDLATSRGVQIDVEQLSERLGVPVVTTSAHRREGIERVTDAVLQAVETPGTKPVQLFPQAFYDEAQQLDEWLVANGEPKTHLFLRERMLLDIRGASEEAASQPDQTKLKAYLEEARGRLAASGHRIPAIETKLRYDWIRQQLDGVFTRSDTDQRLSTSDRIDKVLTHKVTGMIVFALIMLLIFQAIYTWSGPFMEMVEGLQNAANDLVGGMMGPGTLRSLLVDGIIAGVGSVIIFLPQIVMLFAFISILEDCGYMARAAFLMDKLMTKVGLSGKSFLPLMSSFACAIPGVMATRVIENRRDRMVTMLVAPLMSCSARLPVYILMIYTFIPASLLFGFLSLQATVLFAMYAIGALLAIPIAWLFKKTLFKGETPPFVMELPPYKWPSPKIVLDRVYDRSRAFVVRAGTLIFAVTVVVWALGYFPGDHTAQHQLAQQLETLHASPEENAEKIDELSAEFDSVSGALIRESYLGRMGKAIEPAVRPLGWDWRIGIGAVASFPAREVIISTMGTIFSLGGEVDEEDPSLKDALANATWPDGRPLFTVPVALSLMVFFALCAQCGATLMVIRRETNSWRWPIFTFAYMTGLAYIAALLTYQIGTSLMG